MYSSGDKTKNQSCAYQCYYCNKFFTEERHKRHTENCLGVPGVIYNVNTKSLISFQDSFNSKGNLPFVLYFDFETTDNIFDPEQKKMFVVSCVLTVAFYQALNLNRIIIQRSYSHSLEELTTIKYLNDDQMKFIDLQTLNQLKDIAIDISKRKCKNTMGQIFCVETLLRKRPY